MLTWHQLGIHKKPCGFLNLAGKLSFACPFAIVHQTVPNIRACRVL